LRSAVVGAARKFAQQVLASREEGRLRAVHERHGELPSVHHGLRQAAWKQVVVALVTILRKRAADVACCAAAGRVSSVDYRCV